MPNNFLNSIGLVEKLLKMFFCFAYKFDCAAMCSSIPSKKKEKHLYGVSKCLNFCKSGSSNTRSASGTIKLPVRHAMSLNTADLMLMSFVDPTNSPGPSWYAGSVDSAGSGSSEAFFLRFLAGGGPEKIASISGSATYSSSLSKSSCHLTLTSSLDDGSCCWMK